MKFETDDTGVSEWLKGKIYFLSLTKTFKINFLSQFFIMIIIVPNGL